MESRSIQHPDGEEEVANRESEAPDERYASTHGYAVSPGAFWTPFESLCPEEKTLGSIPVDPDAQDRPPQCCHDQEQPGLETV